METIIASIITGAITLCGVLIANSKTQAVMETKVDELTREVREHNNFARRVPLLEQAVKRNEQDIAKLSKYHMEQI